MKSNIKDLPVICFGETLWDVFESEKKPGGAPMNVAVHLKQFEINQRLYTGLGKS